MLNASVNLRAAIIRVRWKLITTMTLKVLRLPHYKKYRKFVRYIFLWKIIGD